MSLDPNYNINSYLRAAKLIHDSRSPLGFYWGKGATVNAATQQFCYSGAQALGHLVIGDDLSMGIVHHALLALSTVLLSEKVFLETHWKLTCNCPMTGQSSDYSN